MRLALFDFDGTLTTRDSLMPFLHALVGTPRFVAGLAACSGALLAYASGRIPNDVAKERVIGHFLRGRAADELAAFGARFAAGPMLARLLRASTLARLREHQAAGDACVLVSASLSVYLGPWALAQGFDALLCSALDVDGSSRVTGRIVPRNCHGPEKARRIDAWLAGRKPTHVTAYGDSRGDLEMLQMADAPHWIGKAAARYGTHTPTGAASANCAAPSSH